MLNFEQFTQHYFQVQAKLSRGENRICNLMRFSRHTIEVVKSSSIRPPNCLLKYLPHERIIELNKSIVSYRIPL